MELKDIKKPEKLYSMSETAKFMGVSYHTLFRAVHSGKIKARNIAKSGKKPIYGFSPEDIQAYYDTIAESKKRT